MHRWTSILGVATAVLSIGMPQHAYAAPTAGSAVAGGASAAAINASLEQLLAAVRTGDSEAVRAQVARGVDVDGADRWGKTALHRASESGRVEMVELLISLGADVGRADKYGDRPLLDAVWKRHLAVVEALLAAGADVNAAGQYGYSALHVAARKHGASVMPTLIRHGANVEQINKAGLTPLREAAANGDVDSVHALIAAGADVNSTDPRGRAPLHESSSSKVVQLLLDAGADIRRVDAMGLNAMDSANAKGRLDVVDFLRGKGLGYGAGFATGEPRTKVTGIVGLLEGVLVAADGDDITVVGPVDYSGKNLEIPCKLSEPVRDARYFVAPDLVRGKRLPQPRPLVTLTDAEIGRYVGTVIRVASAKGRCTALQLPTHAPVQMATAEQLRALVSNVEVRGNIFETIVTGRATRVFRGRLRAIAEQVVTVELTGGLLARCKLTGATRGIYYAGDKGTSARGSLGRVLEDPSILHKAQTDQKLRTRIGAEVAVGPGTGRCEYFEFVSRKRR